MNKLIQDSGFWFVDIPRTSSSSIRAELGAYFGRGHGKMNIPEKQYATEQSFADHHTAQEMRDVLGPELWSKIITFSVVRNPWERIVSYYFYRKGKAIVKIPQTWSLADFVAQLATARSGGPIHETLQYAPHRKTYSEFLTDEAGELLVDHVIRFEDRKAGLKRIGDMIGLKTLGQLAINPASPEGRHYSEYYDTATRLRVGEIFAEDCDRFGYRFETK